LEKKITSRRKEVLIMATGLLSADWESENFYTAYLTADCTDTDTDIFLDIIPTNSEGTLVIDPDSTTNREIIYYSSKTATKVVCPGNGRGYDNSTAIAHTTGTKVIMAPIADWFNSLKTLFTTTPQGWSDLADVPDTVTYNGNRSYDLVFNSNDLTDTVSNGMRLKLTRTVTAPTQCTDLESGSSQYWSKTSPAGTTFTDDFCVGAWIKLESYTLGGIISRFNGTSGWLLAVNADGTIQLGGYNANVANVSKVTSYQSIPLNKWVHVAAQLDMSAFTATTTTSYIMIDGVNVPAVVSRGGTNPTALVQAGDLNIGAYNSGTTFDGKIAQAWYSSAKITQSTIQTFISQGMTGSETSIVSLFSFNGNGNDSNANANNLSANGGALATATDTPFAGGATGTTEYGIITANAFSTNTTLTVQVPEGYAIPTSGGVSSMSYSTQDVPYGFPRDKGKWIVESRYRIQQAEKTNTTYAQWYGDQILAPTGVWNLIGTIPFYMPASATAASGDYAISTSTSAVETGDVTANIRVTNNTTVIARATPATISKFISPTSATTYYGIAKTTNAAGTYGLDSDDVTQSIQLVFNYI
jgi:hypothetical protein